MNSETHVRRKLYLDRKIQGVLLTCLIVLEVLLGLAGIWVLYNQYSSIIDASLYRIHPDPDAPTLAEIMLGAMGQVIAAIFAINIVALVVADRIWVWYVRKVIASIEGSLTRIASLDLRADTDRSGLHRIIDTINRWRDQEHERCSQIHHAAAILTDDIDPARPEKKELILQSIDEIRRHISHASSSENKPV